MFPDIDNKDFARGKGKESTLALEILVLASFPTIRTFHIHDQDVLCHTCAAGFPLVLAHPYPLCGLTTLLLGHDTKLGAEEVVEESGFSGGLRAKDGYKMVVEAGGDDFLDVEIGANVLAVRCTTLAMSRSTTTTVGNYSGQEKENILEDLVLVDNLDAMLVGLPRGILADAWEMRIHHERGGRGVLDIAGTVLAVDLEEFVGHGRLCRPAWAWSCTWCGKNTGG